MRNSPLILPTIICLIKPRLKSAAVKVRGSNLRLFSPTQAKADSVLIGDGSGSSDEFFGGETVGNVAVVDCADGLVGTAGADGIAAGGWAASDGVGIAGG